MRPLRIHHSGKTRPPVLVIGTSTPGKPKVALIMTSLANEFFSTMADGARKHQAAKAATYALVVNGIENETDLLEQVNLVGQMIAQQVGVTPALPNMRN
jgi:ribose transport system substrate-binding protein